MKKRLLVYSYYFHPNENANTNVVMPILKELSQRYELDIFTRDVNENLPETGQWQGMNIIRFKPGRWEKLMQKIYGVYDKPAQDITPPHAAVKLRLWKLMHACFNRPLLERFFNEYPMNHALLQLLQSREYAAFITLSAPIEPHEAALTLSRAGKLKGHKWYPYFMDPHAAYIGLADRYDALMKREMEIYERADDVFTTREIYEDNRQHPLKAYLDKTIPVGYVNLRQLTPQVRPSYLSKDKITCVYTGSLFDSRVREPGYFFQMLQDCDDRFEIHIVCYELDGHNRRLKETYVDHNPHIVWHDRASMEECLNLMCWADVLINLGNRCTNQTPSKIFDYISAGKPIVNIHPLPNDTAKPYLDRYPLILDIQEKTSLDHEDARRFMDFCAANRGQSVPFEEVNALYGDMASYSAAQAFAEVIERQP